MFMCVCAHGVCKVFVEWEPEKGKQIFNNICVIVCMKHYAIIMKICIAYDFIQLRKV